MDAKAVEKDWRSRGFGFGIWTDPPGQVWKDYVHDTDELFMVIFGDVMLEFKKEKLHLKAGEEILIPAGEYHTVRNIGRNESRWYYGYKQS